ncbi:methyltransferase domain-containing protein [Aestuariibacter sp. A3R04]|uniref:methyltransferase domain-containing protein n=1 Tax=Aestuariibacter sp. A3R04 TaxID=2841571 RepID=UPI001C09E92F|nr:methyltransferase domain-containing protein [Aestuariibacter sp. A3R04]MBU3022961.1 methyltransferase domain-containing protein [Aestuariibacter sp. A3R04]
MKATDQYFDGIAEKFARNIYGTTKGRLRHLLLLEVLTPYLDNRTPMKVADIGGGTGIMSKAIADFGHCVHLFDASEDILSLAQEFVSDDENIQVFLANIQHIENLSTYDFVVCHAVLEWLAAPLDTLAGIYHKMKPGARLSLSFFNKDAALFGNALYGNFDYIAKGMKVKNQVRLNPNNPLSPQIVLSSARDMGFDVERISGIRCFHDYMKEKQLSDEQFSQLLALEKNYMEAEPYCWLGKYMHFMLKKI